ncbi:MAG: hypothetical protein VX028_02530 [Nanoarchaeota archaeon]|nr:hypothetical protein [Nanoarchaeota archaeon]
MNEEKLKEAFSKIKEEMLQLSEDISELQSRKPQKVIETRVIEKEVSKDKGLESEVIEKLQNNVAILEHSLNSLEQSTVETLQRLRDEFNTKLEEEISSIRLELMDVIMRKEQSPLEQTNPYNF